MRFFKKILSTCVGTTLLLSSSFTLAHSNSIPNVNVEKLLETEKSWDGVQYKKYPEGTPQISILRITVAPHSSLSWHTHPMPHAAYVLDGMLTVEKKATGEKKRLKSGDVLPELVDSVHRGYTGEEGVTLIVFYAGKKGMPLSIPAT